MFFNPKSVFFKDGSFMGSTNFVSSLWLPDIQIFKCKQFKKRQIVTDVAGHNCQNLVLNQSCVIKDNI